MLVRGLFALLIFLPYWFLVPSRPWWLTLLVAAGAFGAAHGVEFWLRRSGDEQMRKKAKILLSVAVLVIGGGLLIRSSIAEADYYKHVDELNADLDRFSGKRLKVHGFVEAGSIEEKIVGNETTRSFVLEYKGERIRVRHKGPKPDTFRDLAEVVAQGKLVEQKDGEMIVEASELMAKCPSKYEQNRRKAPAGTQASNSAEPGGQ
jgi:cytochrome c-type biogenesis protein CcmE